MVEQAAGCRKSEVVEEHLNSFDGSVRASVEIVAMGLWQGYISALEGCIPEARQVTRFAECRVTQHLGTVVGNFHNEEDRLLQSLGVSVLKGK